MSSEAGTGGHAARADRVALSADVFVRRLGGHKFSVRAFNVSPTGCKIEFVERPSVGERVWLKFEGLEAIQSTVRWVDGHYGGVEFDRPLYPAIFDRISSATT